MIDIKIKVKTEKRTAFLKEFKLNSVPRIGEIVKYDKVAYKVVDIEYEIPVVGEGYDNIDVIVQAVS